MRDLTYAPATELSNFKNMGHRLSKIATRTGDDGTTGLGDGSRTDKDALRVQAMGDVDELNSHIGVLLCRVTQSSARHDDTQFDRCALEQQRVIHPVE